MNLSFAQGENLSRCRSRESSIRVVITLLYLLPPKHIFVSRFLPQYPRELGDFEDGTRAGRSKHFVDGDAVVTEKGKDRQGPLPLVPPLLEPPSRMP